MSRNLAQTNCARCGHIVDATGPDHLITPAEAGRYFDEYAGMVVCEAECRLCHAKYLGWVRESPAWLRRHGLTSSRSNGDDFFDLSYRSSFNDEPGPGDWTDWEPPPALGRRKEPEPLCVCGHQLDEHVYGFRCVMFVPTSEEPPREIPAPFTPAADPATCVHAWEPHVWERGAKYCPRCATEVKEGGTP